MSLPVEAYVVLIPVTAVAVTLVLVSYLTRSSRNFRSSRNKRARKQF